MKERIIQFGTGMLLRALPDFLIDKANKASFYDGTIVQVKSTSSETKLFNQQQNQYFVLEKGLESGKMVSRVVRINSISKTLAAQHQWAEILECARNPKINVLLSNTTEAGLVHTPEVLSEKVPSSFPAKLTVYLHERFKAFGGSKESGMVLLPCELLVNNGELLRSFVLHHAEANRLGNDFIHWIKTANYFCNTLVDRIVPGKSEQGDQIVFEGKSFTDPLHTAAETYLLWAIELPKTPSAPSPPLGFARSKGSGAESSEVLERILEVIKFVKADERMIITDDLTPYRERKLRILNGSNTMVSAVGHLAGLQSTYDTVTDPTLLRYTSDLINKEIIPTIADLCPDAEAFAAETLDRFRNEAIRYPLLTIASQYASKMNSRNVETIFRYWTLRKELPLNCCIGLAAFFIFYLHDGKENDQYYRLHEGGKFFYKDEHATYLCQTLEKIKKDTSTTSTPSPPLGFARGKGSGAESSGVDNLGQKNSDATNDQVSETIRTILSNKNIFSRDLGEIPGLIQQVAEIFLAIRQKGMNEVLRESQSLR